MSGRIILNELTINVLKEHQSQCQHIRVFNPGGDLFQHPNGLLIDMQSINLMCLIYDKLQPDNQSRFNSVLQDEYKFARFCDTMWKWVQ